VFLSCSKCWDLLSACNVATRKTTVVTATGCGLDDLEVPVRVPVDKKKRILLSSHLPYRPWNPLSFLSYGPRAKGPRREGPSTEVKKTGIRTRTWEALIKLAPWPESESELYRPSGRRLSAKLVAIFANRGCYVVSVTYLYGRILGFLDRSCYFFFQVAPQLYSRGWVNPVPDPLLHRKYGSAGNRIRTSGSVARNFED
jgi:hypothetical protein